MAKRTLIASLLVFMMLLVSARLAAAAGHNMNPGPQPAPTGLVWSGGNSAESVVWGGGAAPTGLVWGGGSAAPGGLVWQGIAPPGGLVWQGLAPPGRTGRLDWLLRFWR